MSAEVEEKKGRRRRRGKQEEIVEEVEDDKAITTKKGTLTTGRRNADEVRKSGIIGDIREYLAGVRAEAEKVSWPNREETIRLTRIIIIVTVIASLVLGLISFGFTELFALGINQPIIFLLFAVVVVAVWFFMSRRSANKSVDTSINSSL